MDFKYAGPGLTEAQSCWSKPGERRQNFPEQNKAQGMQGGTSTHCAHPQSQQHPPQGAAQEAGGAPHGPWAGSLWAAGGTPRGASPPAQSRFGSSTSSATSPAANPSPRDARSCLDTAACAAAQ